MESDPDLSEAYWQGHFSTKETADAYAADIEKLAGLQGETAPRTSVTRDREGGWHVWVWE
jgi:hypothetical protein